MFEAIEAFVRRRVVCSVILAPRKPTKGYLTYFLILIPLFLVVKTSPSLLYLSPNCSQIAKELVAANPLPTSIANDDGIFPLRLAMVIGLQSIVSLLVEKYPQAVLKRKEF
ncbi:hypothetical protein ACHAWO_014029 [Cyclotella atomus]|uniref:Uncharacterized protein n=1 Tax=Cyclotella atomus TaxID=382360 RepID=A0ABD3QDZ0_9STRA